MNRVILVSAGLLGAAALAAGCSSSGSSASKTSTAPSTSSSAPAASSGLHAQNSKFGQILVNSSGKTLYLLTADKGNQSSCYNACAAIWAPDITSGTPTSSGVTASMVGTTARTDNTTQVTYNGHPLYTYAGDTNTTDVNGESIATFGGIWYVVGPDGNAVTSSPSAPAPSTSGGGGYGY